MLLGCSVLGLDDAMTGDTIAPPGDKDVSKDEEETGVNKDEKETEVNKDEEETGVNKDEEETAMDQDQNEEVPKEVAIANNNLQHMYRLVLFGS